MLFKKQKPNKKAIVLSSGGVDSTTCIGIAINDVGKENVMTVSVSYGQKHKKELGCADKIAKYYDVPHRVIDLSKSGIFDGSNCSLLEGSDREIPLEDYASQVKDNDKGKVSTYVPFRNALILSCVTALAQSVFPDDDVDIYLGAHADDAAGNAYADCSPKFTNAMNKAINLGTYDQVQLKAPLVKLNKAQVVKKGLELNVPYELTWSCYQGKEKACGKCGTCIDRLNAFKENGVEDPIEYEE